MTAIFLGWCFLCFLVVQFSQPVEEETLLFKIQYVASLFTVAGLVVGASLVLEYIWKNYP